MWSLEEDTETTAGGDPQRAVGVGFGGLCHGVTAAEKGMSSRESEGSIQRRKVSFKIPPSRHRPKQGHAPWWKVLVNHQGIERIKYPLES